MPKELKHLLIATTEDPSNPKSWSGIPYSLRVALERQVEKVSVFRPPPPRRTPIDALKRIVFGAHKYPLWITRATLKQNAQTLQAEIARTIPDAVLSISSQCVAYLDKPGVPVFLFSDAPYLAFCETYARWDTPPLRIQEFAAEEARAGRRVDGLCFGSGWACNQARELYGIRDGSTPIYETPLGANSVPSLTREEIFAHLETRIARLASDGIELLYLGKDWERKGGPLALQVARKMRDAGHKVQLHVVGCRPDLGEDAGPDGFVTIHGPLYQTDPAQGAQLTELFLRSHFLIVPTLAECFGIVFAEAQAFGLPPVSRSVDAVPSIVLDEWTGLLFDVPAPAGPYADKMLDLLARPDDYRKMAQQARLWFEKSLTWDRSAERIAAAIRERLAAESL